MGKKRGEYKKYLYDLNIEMPKSTHYKKIKTFYQKPPNNENDDEQQSTSGNTNNINNDINFDNIYQSLISLFVLSTLNDWDTYMY